MNKKESAYTIIKQQITQRPWIVSLTHILYYFSFVLATIILWIMSLDIISKLQVLTDFFVDVAKPIYQATGTLDPYSWSQVLLFSDLLHITMRKILIYLFLFILVFSILRGLRDWLLLGKKQPFYIHIIVVFAVTIFLTFFAIFLSVKLNNVFVYLAAFFLFFIVHKYSLLFSQGLLINTKFTKRMLLLLGIQLLSYLCLLLAGALVYMLIALIFGSLIFGAVLLFISWFVLVILREEYLISFLLVKNE